MKKILFLIHTLGGGGAERVLVDLVNNLDKNKYKITVMTVVDTGIYKEALLPEIEYKTMFKLPRFVMGKNESGSLLHDISRKKKVLIKLYTSFWKYISSKFIYKHYIKDMYDFEVAFLEGICAKIISSSSNPKSRKYVWIHIDLLNQRKSGNVFKNLREEKQTYSRFDKIICVSEYVKEQFVKLFKIDQSNVIVKYNPVDEKVIYEKGLEETCGMITKRKFTICSIGRLNKQKSYMRLLRAANVLYKNNFDFDLWIIGEGTDKGNLSEYIKMNDLSDKVFLLGYKKNPYCFLKQADFFVCSSLAEGYSTAVTEAVILGIPVLTTDCSGMREILGNSEYGIIVENSIKGITDGLEKILTDTTFRNYYQHQAEIRRRDFRLETQINAIEELFMSERQ